MIFFFDEHFNVVWQGHIGSKTNHSTLHKVEYVQADGDELSVLHSFGFPDYKSQVQRFVGEKVKEAYLNWR